MVKYLTKLTNSLPSRGTSLHLGEGMVVRGNISNHRFLIRSEQYKVSTNHIRLQGMSFAHTCLVLRVAKILLNTPNTLLLGKAIFTTFYFSYYIKYLPPPSRHSACPHNYLLSQDTFPTLINSPLNINSSHSQSIFISAPPLPPLKTWWGLFTR